MAKRRKKTKRNYGPWGVLEALWKPKRRPKKKGFSLFSGRTRKKKTTVIGWLCKWLFILIIWALTIATLIVLYYSYDLPDISSLKEETYAPRITVSAANPRGGDTIILAQYGDLLGEYVHVNELPAYVTHAILATEDRRFYSHVGIDAIGLLRAAYVNYQAGRVVQGGSTITQQLAKNLFLTADRTIKRKIQELVLALWLEKEFSKDDILTIYLNRVYLGAGNYGIDAAARFYFNKPATQVNLYEAAILAGLLKAPSRYAPTHNPDKAEKRARQVLMNMKQAGYLRMYEENPERYVQVQVRQDARGVLKDPYFTDWVASQLPDYVGSIEDDITVTTTLHYPLQHIVQSTVQKYVERYGKEGHFSQAAVVALAPKGEVLAMVGGANYQQSQFNRAVKALRQPGSAFKLCVYLAALQHGMQPSDIVVDAPFEGKDGYKPGNYGGEYAGKVSLQRAFADSINTVAVRLTDRLGVRSVYRMARLLGVQTPLNNDLSIALGTSEVTLLSLAHMYLPMINGGVRVEPYAVSSIHDSSDMLVYHQYPNKGRKILGEHVVDDMQAMLREVIVSGTGKHARTAKARGGKTGTSQDYRDAWFVGYTDDMVLAIWVGNDDNTPMHKVTGGSIPAKMWREIVEEYYS